MCNYPKPGLGALTLPILTTMVAALHLYICFSPPSCVCGKGAKRETSLPGFHTLGVSHIPGANNG